jgi:hypothetical protein
LLSKKQFVNSKRRNRWPGPTRDGTPTTAHVRRRLKDRTLAPSPLGTACLAPSQRDGPTEPLDSLPFSSSSPNAHARNTTSSSSRSRDPTNQAPTNVSMPPRRRAALSILFLHFLAACVSGGAAAEPMELYFSPAELARVAGYGEEPVSVVSVSGQVTCELCVRPGAQLLAFELPGTQ